jgi:hypothetical protein
MRATRASSSPHMRLFALAPRGNGRFIVSSQSSQRLNTYHGQRLGGRFVSAPEPRLSPYASQRRGLLGGWSFLRPSVDPAATHQLASQAE